MSVTKQEAITSLRTLETFIRGGFVGEDKGFEEALITILAHEGGYVNNPDDPGGATNMGITQAVYDSWRRSQALVAQPVRHISPEEVETIYWSQYWREGGCDSMPWPVSLIHFDGCVNHGVRSASRILQKALGVTVDGVIGPITLGKLMDADPPELSRELLFGRLDYYASIVVSRSRSLQFLPGWVRRITSLRKVAGV